MTPTGLLIATTAFLTLIGQYFVRLPTVRQRLRRPFWALVEYLWIGLAFFGLWFALGELNRLQVQREVDQLRVETEVNYRDIAAAVNYQASLLHEAGDKSRVAQWFEFATRVLREGLTSYRWRWFLGQNEDLWNPATNPRASRVPQLDLGEFPRLTPDEPFADAARSILLDLDKFAGVYDRLSSKRQHLSAVSELSARRWIFAILFPLAFALRIAKVTEDFGVRIVLAPEAGSHRAPMSSDQPTQPTVTKPATELGPESPNNTRMEPPRD